jgi:hypothetical protein
MTMQTLLANVTKGDVLTDPFPHIVIKDTLPEDLCTQLIREFPAIDVITEGQAFSSNDRFSYSAHKVMQNSAISDLWREFIAAQVSETFWQQFLQLFQTNVRQLHPNFEQEFGALDQLKPGVRRAAETDTNLLLDAQICLNAPVLKSSPMIKQPHVDRSRVLFAGLYYLRHPDDQSTGGNLEIYRSRHSQPQGFKGQFIEDKHVELVKTVQYERNVLILFVNSIHSLHGVTVRSVTETPRCFVNLVGELNRPIYDLEQYQAPKNWATKVTQKLTQVLSTV